MRKRTKGSAAEKSVAGKAALNAENQKKKRLIVIFNFWERAQ